MSGFQPPADPTSPPGPPDNPVVPIPADDAISVSRVAARVSAIRLCPAWQYGPYVRACMVLGQQAAWAKMVRPYRSLISAQAIYRREVFQ